MRHYVRLPPHLQEKVACGLFLRPKHCPECLTQRTPRVLDSADKVAHTVSLSPSSPLVSGASVPLLPSESAPQALLSRLASIDVALLAMAAAAAASVALLRRQLLNSPDFSDRNAVGFFITSSARHVRSSPSCSSPFCSGVAAGTVPAGNHFYFEAIRGSCWGSGCACASADFTYYMIGPDMWMLLRGEERSQATVFAEAPTRWKFSGESWFSLRAHPPTHGGNEQRFFKVGRY